VPRPNNDVQQGDGVVRGALTLAGRRTLDLGLIGFARDEGLPGTGGNPTMNARFRRCAASRICTTGRATTWAGRPLSAACSRPAARQAERPGRELGGRRRVADARNDHGGRAERPRGAPARRLGAGARVLEGGVRRRTAVNDLAMVPSASRRAGWPASRRRDRSALALGRPGFHPVGARRGDAGSVSRLTSAAFPSRTRRAVFRVSPVLRAALVRPLLDRDR
jgi:hypothetical protein